MEVSKKNLSFLDEIRSRGKCDRVKYVCGVFFLFFQTILVYIMVIREKKCCINIDRLKLYLRVKI